MHSCLVASCALCSKNSLGTDLKLLYTLNGLLALSFCFFLLPFFLDPRNLFWIPDPRLAVTPLISSQWHVEQSFLGAIVCFVSAVCVAQGGLAIPTMAGRGTGGLSSAHCMAASHSPHLEEGLLAQSLENHMPAFGEPTAWHESVGR